MVGFGGRRRKDMMEDKEAVAVTKAKEENTEVSPTMDDMEEEAASSGSGLGSGMGLTSQLISSQVLNLDAGDGVALVLYVHDAVGLDPVGSGSGQAIVQIGYAISEAVGSAQDQPAADIGLPSLPVSTAAGSGSSFQSVDLGSAANLPAEVEMTTLPVLPDVEALERTQDAGSLRGMVADMANLGQQPRRREFWFSTPEAQIFNGQCSWGSAGRVLKFPNDLAGLPAIKLHVKVWQVVGRTGLLGGAKVLLGESVLDIGQIAGKSLGLEGIHDCEVELSNRFIPAPLDQTPKPGDHVAVDVDVGAGTAEASSSSSDAKVKISWRLESLRGKGSDQDEMRISKLPYRAHSYAHGGFMGASVSMMGEERWRDILKELESPSVYRSCQSALESEDFMKRIKLMPLLENSPILCAYGLVRSNSLQMVENLSKSPLTRFSVSPYIAPREGESDSGLNTSNAASPLSSAHEDPSWTSTFASSFGGAEFAHIPSAGTIGDSPINKKYDSSLRTVGSTQIDTPFETPRRNEMNASLLRIIATSESKAQMRWKMFARRLLKIRRRWRFAIKAVLRQVRISSSWEKSQMGNRVNRYGYSPVPLEWDLWVSPSKPWSLAHATVDHGSPAALVQQAIFSTLGLKKCAGMLGSKHINAQGVPPVQWLTQFGEALNLAANGDKLTPLPLHEDATVEHFLELEVKLVSGEDLVAMDITNTSDPYCIVYVKGDALYRRKQKSAVRSSTLKPKWDELLKVWPIDPDCDRELVLVVEVWDHDTTSGDDFMGKFEVKLSDLNLDEASVFERVALTPDEKLGGGGEGETPGAQAVLNAATELRNGGEGAIGRITFECRLVEKTVIEAAEDLEIPRHAFQSCLCMLSEPGGLFLDVKSAYSKAKHLSLFSTTLAGLGICVKSICSFSPAQLKLPRHEGVPSPLRTVRFFHGLSGLENACDNGQVKRNQNVFFNGASFLMDPTKGDSEGGSLALAKLGALDTMYVNRYQALAETYRFNGGIYVQETDCCATCLESLTLLVSQRPDIFPLGFAYGHVPGYSVSSFFMRGRGFASQQIVEEFQARAELSGKVQRSIQQGKHKEVSLSVAISWLERLLYGSNFLYQREQLLVLKMLGDIGDDTSLSKVVQNIGGVDRVFLRFFEHYEATSPFTVHETGFNFNKTKELCRFLRDRGVLERLSLDRKINLGKFFVSRACYGFGMTFYFQKTGLRR